MRSVFWSNAFYTNFVEEKCMRTVLILGYVTFLRVKNKTIYDVRYDDMLGMLMKRHRKVSKPAISIL